MPRTGLVKFDGTNWEAYDTLSNNFVNSIAIDDSANKWIGTDDGLVKFKEPDDWTFYKTSSSTLPDKPQSVSNGEFVSRWYVSGSTFPRTIY